MSNKNWKRHPLQDPGSFSLNNKNLRLKSQVFCSTAAGSVVPAVAGGCVGTPGSCGEVLVWWAAHTPQTLNNTHLRGQFPLTRAG